MIKHAPLPGMPGGTPYDQEADWGFVEFADPVEQSASFSAGEGSIAPHQARKSYLGRTAALYLSIFAASGLVFSVIDDSNNDHVVNAGAAPDKLSAAVKADYSAVLEMNYQDQQGYIDIGGTAVKIGNNLALTAGHVVINDQVSITSQDCANTSMSVFDDQGNDTPVKCWVGTNGSLKGHDVNGAPDYALLRISANPSFADLPSIAIAPKPLHVGEKVFFINYEQISPAENFNRFPSPADVPQRTYNGGNYSTRAAEFVGVVIGKFGSQYNVATGMRSYGPTSYSQSNLRPGGSGGAVLNASGQLEGLSVASTDDFVSPGDVLAWDNVKLPLKNSQEFRIAYIQPINPGLVKNSEAQLNSSH